MAFENMKRMPPNFEPDIITPWTPWRRLMARTVLRAVLDIINNSAEDRNMGDPVAFLNDRNIRDLSDAWELSIPWCKIDELARHEM